MTTTEWGDLLNATNVTAGRVQQLTPPINFSPNQWSRQTDLVEIRNIKMNLMITPNINLTGSEPPLMDAEQQIVEVMFFVDTWAFMSNKTTVARPIQMVEALAAQNQSSQNADAIMTVATNGGSSPPAQAYMYPVGTPSTITLLLPISTLLLPLAPALSPHRS